MKKTREYFLRAEIQDINFRLVEGWNENSDDPYFIYPWKTKAQCRLEAARDEVKPVFLRGDKND